MVSKELPLPGLQLKTRTGGRDMRSALVVVPPLYGFKPSGGPGYMKQEALGETQGVSWDGERLLTERPLPGKDIMNGITDE